MGKSQEYGIFYIALHLIITGQIVPVELVLALVRHKHSASKFLNGRDGVIILRLILIVAHKSCNKARVVIALITVLSSLESFLYW
jgi:hypothetical protein